MKERTQRFFLFLAAVVASVPLFIKGRAAIPWNGSAPFLPFSTSGIKVRLNGAVRSPGVYVFDPGADLTAVINLTDMVSCPGNGDLLRSNTLLITGTSLEIPCKGAEPAEIIVRKMRAQEMLMLGIPLNPDQMDRDDWSALPGIGPKLADRIIGDRQKYGAFRSAESLKRVPGIGERKFSHLKRYFTEM